jgi:site-specific DNA recombinase
MTDTGKIHCAIYTRKSSEEGLEQSFNSLHAQREACEAYIKSQKHEGWQPLSTHYDDGGFSGGSMERPALQNLLGDIADGKINTVVVYKVDRLTRSLLDFSKIIESFDAKGVSFVSVTQQFNTTTSMGRLTLNVLLSFAQFEREVTGERIRDKIAASKKKGMWMGGTVPLGYDVKDRKLVINPREAEKVRNIFNEYLRLGCVSLLKRHLDQHRIFSKVRVSAGGRKSGGVPFSRGALYELLANEVYVGKIVHKEQSYAGQHEAIIAPELLEKASSLLATNNRGRRMRSRKSEVSPLVGLLFDEHGNRYTPTHCVKDGKRYRYYTSQAVIKKSKDRSPIGRIPATEIERAVEHRLRHFFASSTEVVDALANSESGDQIKMLIAGAAKTTERWTNTPADTRLTDLRYLVRRVVVRQNAFTIELWVDGLKALLLDQNFQTMSDAAGSSKRESTTIRAAFVSRQTQKGFRLVLAGEQTVLNGGDPSMIKAIARAHDWQQRIINGQVYGKDQLAAETGLNASYVGKILLLASLSPSSVERLLTRRDTLAARLEKFARHVPLAWAEQIRP